MTGSQWIARIDQMVWGPGTLALLLGTGMFLALRTRFLPWRNLRYALHLALGREARTCRGTNGVSPFSTLMTALAATVGTGNIVGVATALTAGGPGALVWMELSAVCGLSTKCAECLLAVRFRQKNRRGDWCGGPMYVMRTAVRPKWLGAVLASSFALFTVLASFGIGNLAQAHSIAAALHTAFALPPIWTGAAVALLSLCIFLGGLRSISKVSGILVPVMAGGYLLAGLAVLWGHLPELPAALGQMVRLAFSPGAAAGGLAGTAAASFARTVQAGVSRGCFSNEAGLGAAAITAASADTDSPAEQGYIHMTSTVFDTLVICTVTGLCICVSGALEAPGTATGAALTVQSFETVLHRTGGVFVSVSIALFAFSTILGWEYQGETALEYLTGGRFLRLYRVLFALTPVLGAAESLETVWSLSDVCNGLMAVPNLLSLLLLSGIAARELQAYQPQVERWRKRRPKNPSDQ